MIDTVKYKAAYEQVAIINRSLQKQIEQLNEEVSNLRTITAHQWVLIGQLEDTITSLQEEQDFFM